MLRSARSRRTSAAARRTSEPLTDESRAVCVPCVPARDAPRGTLRPRWCALQGRTWAHPLPPPRTRSNQFRTVDGEVRKTARCGMRPAFDSIDAQGLAVLLPAAVVEALAQRAAELV